MAKKRETLGQRHYSFWMAQIPDYDESFVYVIRAGSRNPVKIGVAKKPLQRLKTLQTGNPSTLRLLLVVPGAEKLETVLHRRFAEYRVDDSEWFYGDGVKQIIDFVTELAVEMVRSHQHGAFDPPPIQGFPGWTVAERMFLTPPPPAPPKVRLPDGVVVFRPGRIIDVKDQEVSYVPTIARRIRGERIGPNERNRAGATQ